MSAGYHASPFVSWVMVLGVVVTLAWLAIEGWPMIVEHLHANREDARRKPDPRWDELFSGEDDTALVAETDETVHERIDRMVHTLSAAGYGSPDEIRRAFTEAIVRPVTDPPLVDAAQADVAAWLDRPTQPRVLPVIPKQQGSR